MKALVLFAFLFLGFGTGAKAQSTTGSIKTVLLQLEQEIITYDHTQASLVTAYVVLNSTFKSVSLGKTPAVNQYLIWRPELITEDVVLFQIHDFIDNGLSRNPPLRIVKPAYDKLVALLATLQSSRL